MIIHTIPSIESEASGPSYSVRRLCESLISFDCGVSLYCVNSRRSGLGSPDWIVESGRGWGPNRLGRSPIMYDKISVHAKAGHVRLLHNHSLWMMPNVYPGWISKKYSIKYVVSPRGTLSPWAFRQGSALKKIFWPLIQRPALHSVSCWHATSVEESGHIRSLGFLQPIAVIPNGVDIPDLGQKVIVKKKELIFLGRIHPIKGIEALLDAWSLLEARYSDWTLTIAGPIDGTYEKSIVQRVKTMRLRHVNFSGPIYGHEKFNVLSEASIFILPSKSENFGMAVAEALASGTPAIVTKGAPWSGLNETGSGWWIEDRVETIANSLDNAMKMGTGELAKMGTKGREWMKAQYSWNTVAMEMMKVYEWLLTGGPIPRCVIL